MEGIQRKSYSEVVIEGVRRRARVFVGDSIVRKTDRALNKVDDVVLCFPGAKIEAITESVEKIVGLGKGGSILVHIGTNNASGILPVMGSRGQGYRNCQRMAINMLVQQLCREEEV